MVHARRRDRGRDLTPSCGGSSCSCPRRFSWTRCSTRRSRRCCRPTRPTSSSRRPAPASSAPRTPAGTLLGALPAGWLAGRIGAKPTMLLGLGLLFGSSLTFGVADDIVVLDSARFVQGLGGACTWAGGLAWLIGLTPRERRGELIGSALGAAIIGVLLGPVLGGAATETSPELVFSAVSPWWPECCSLVAALTPAGPRAESVGWSELGAAMRTPGVLVAVWLFTLPALFSGVIDVLVPLRLDDLGASGVTIGAVFLAAASVEGVISPFVGQALRSPRALPADPVRAGRRGGRRGASAAPGRGVAAWRNRGPVGRGARAVLGAGWSAALGRLRVGGPRPGLCLRPDEPRLGGGPGGGRSGGGRSRRRHVRRGALHDAGRAGPGHPAAHAFARAGRAGQGR